jgi:peptide/nickel transport system substrate-binding protein
MKKTLGLGIVCCLTVLFTLATSCGGGGTTSSAPATTAATSAPIATTAKTTAAATTAAAVPTADKPVYGGKLVTTVMDPLGWDQAFTSAIYTYGLGPVGDVMIQPDWKKGPAGTNETSWTRGNLGRYSLNAPGLATSWEMPDNETLVYHLRKGVKWQNIPPVNGREFTAEDAKWNLNRLLTAPSNTTPANQKAKSFTAVDKYTLEVKVPSQFQGQLLFSVGGGAASAVSYFFPPEVIQKNGDMKDWKNVVGTGPFILKDYVNASSISYVRNPDYWEKDPQRPDNQLPYLEKMERLIITDSSTVISALRTGKIDIQGLARAAGVGWEDAALLQKQTKLQSLKKVADLVWIWARLDKPDLPFKDIRVRRAMNMAIDRDLLVKTYYGGTATAYTSPWPPTQDYAPFYTPLDQQTKEVQELFSYNPEKAKQLLSDAGYPKGFKCNVVCGSASVDFLSLIREAYLKVGIDMEVKPLDTGVMSSVMASRTHEQMIYSLFTLSSPAGMNWVRSETADDRAMYENPYTRQVYDKVSSMIGKDEAGITRELKEVSKFILGEVIGIMLPQTYNYTMWWPWVQGYHGEGFDDGGWATKYFWVDPKLKSSMGY